MPKYMDERLNEILNENNCITVFYGEGGTGKTCFMLIHALEILKVGKKVIFIDTENSFSLERFKQISGENYKEYLDNLILIKITNFKKQHEQILSLNKDAAKNVSLIIIDSISSLFRMLHAKKRDLARAMMFRQVKHLSNLSIEIPILITNQVYADINNKKLQMLAGDIFKRFCNIQIKLDKGLRHRLFILEKPAERTIPFDIVNDGVVFYNEENKP